jgi:transposase
VWAARAPIAACRDTGLDGPAALDALEACGASHHWGRLVPRLGHRVRLIPAQYVKPFVKRGKSDRIDAEAARDRRPPPATA